MTAETGPLWQGCRSGGSGAEQTVPLVARLCRIPQKTKINREKKIMKLQKKCCGSRPDFVP
jgi:hypothetical protein